jgi:hypothetical protein
MSSVVKQEHVVTHRSPEEVGRVKIVGRCVCGQHLATFYVEPGGPMVAVGGLSWIDPGGIEQDKGADDYRFHCTRASCPVDPFTLSIENVVTMAKAAAGLPRSRGRSIALSPALP